MKDKDKFTFVTQHKAHSKSVCQWIMNLGATKHMISQRVVFDTDKVISLYAWMMIALLKLLEWSPLL